MTAPRPALLLTRPREASIRFAAKLRDHVMLGAVEISPLIRINARNISPDLAPYAAVILSSAHAARPDVGASGKTAYCVGPRTTKTAHAAGFDARQMGETADDLVDALVARQPAGPLLHLRGHHTRGDIAARLAAHGMTVEECVVYDQEAMKLTPAAREMLDGERPVILPLFSPRTARLLCQQASGGAPRWVVAMSPSVAEAAAPLAAERVIIAKRPDGAAMCAAVSGLYPGPAPVEGGQGNA